ncbi:membrane protein [Fulvitalea axinellae]|uniref:Membrane protein n=1 Tax=Fulvitalea axinellae TaxID=1182444 RepID=A0AAU9D3S1_9BACT|nr:membrane protein [Fulvitalea axinellae]
MKGLGKIFRALAQSFLNELRLVFSDMGLAVTLLLPAFAYPLLFATAYQKEVVNDVPTAVVDHSQSPLSWQLIRMLDATDYVKAVNFSDMASARDAYYKGEVRAVFSVPEDFEKDILSSEQTDVTLYADAAYVLPYKQAVKGCLYASQTLGTGIKVRKLMAKGMPAKAALATGMPLRFKNFQLFNPAGGYGVYILALLGLAVIQQTLLMTIGLANGTSNEYRRYRLSREKGTENAPPAIVLLGRALFYTVVSYILMGFCIGAISKWFDYPARAHAGELALFLLPFVLACVFFSFAITGRMKTREQVLFLLTFATLPFLFLSAIPWPTEGSPVWLTALGKLVPSTEAFGGYLKMNLAGANFNQVSGHWNTLWLIVLLYYMLALILRQKPGKAG